MLESGYTLIDVQGQADKKAKFRFEAAILDDFKYIGFTGSLTEESEQ